VAGIRFVDGEWRAFRGAVAPADFVPREAAYYLGIFQAISGQVAGSIGG
jgi:hypothetical protein